MMYDGNGMGSGGWILMSLLAVLLLAALTVAVAAARPDNRSAPPASSLPTQAEHVLAERFARGEIDAEEYRQRLRILRFGSVS